MRGGAEHSLQAAGVCAGREQSTDSREPAFEIEFGLSSGVYESGQQQGLACDRRQAPFTRRRRSDTVLGEPGQKLQVIIAAGIAKVSGADSGHLLERATVVFDFPDK